MDELRLGDQISCVVSNNTYGFCPVYNWSRIGLRSSYLWEEIYVLGADSPLILSKRHLVFVTRADGAGATPSTGAATSLPDGVYAAAGCVKVGDWLVTADTTGLFTKRQVTRREHDVEHADGAYSPMVSSGSNGGRPIISSVVVTSQLTGFRGISESALQGIYLLDAPHFPYLDESQDLGTPVNDLPTLWKWPGAHVLDPWGKPYDGRSPWFVAKQLARRKYRGTPFVYTLESLRAFALKIQALLQGGRREELTEDGVLALFDQTAFVNATEQTDEYPIQGGEPNKQAKGESAEIFCEAGVDWGAADHLM